MVKKHSRTTSHCCSFLIASYSMLIQMVLPWFTPWLTARYVKFHNSTLFHCTKNLCYIKLESDWYSLRNFLQLCCSNFCKQIPSFQNLFSLYSDSEVYLFPYATCLHTAAFCKTRTDRNQTEPSRNQSEPNKNQESCMDRLESTRKWTVLCTCWFQAWFFMNLFCTVMEVAKQRRYNSEKQPCINS